MRLKSKEMFLHAYNSYMKYAYPADELMPLSCKGRYRGLDQSRGDIDDILGNFSLTLIDSLDTLFIMNEFDEFERAIKLVIENVNFDSNLTVSVFEVNIRIIGGLLGAHIGALELKLSNHGNMKLKQNNSRHHMLWYNDELLWMADEVAKKLLPAFDTQTGIPYPRINLRYGTASGDNLGDVSTCTACAGTMILEFAALSRLTGNPIYEEKAARAMTYLWEQRNRFSNLMGSVINIHDGNWMRKESGVGAGIDSYYEYLLKAYVLLGDDTYLHRFNTHYRAIKRYVSTSDLSALPLFLDVKMHQPLQRTKNFMDSLLAFWPGLQVLFGDIKNAIAFHEILSQVMKRHSFLPEAFTTDFHVYWGHHLLRPEFIESNYFLYHSTGDPYYLEIGAQVLNNLEVHARVKCGFAAIQDVRIMNHSDQMDSFVLAETFKYLYLLFTEPHQLPINLDKYLFTTEGHLLPLNLALVYTNNKTKPIASKASKMHLVNQTSFKKDFNPINRKSTMELSKLNEIKSCQNHMQNADSVTIITWVFLNFRNASKPAYKSPVQHLAALIREPLRDIVVRGGSFQLHSSEGQTKIPLLPKDFLPNNPEHINILKKMGIQVHQLSDGRLQLFHQPNMSESDIWSSLGETFMAEMMKLTQNSAQNIEIRFVSVIFNDSYISKMIKAAPAQFGKFPNSKDTAFGHFGKIVIAEPLNACVPLTNANEVKNKIVIAKRGDCMFIEKARFIQKAGASGTIIIDHIEGSSFDNSALFSMSGDGENNVDIPVVFIFHTESQILFDMIKTNGIGHISVLLSQTFPEIDKIQSYLKEKEERSILERNLKAKVLELISEQAHARVDMHFTNLKKHSEEIKTIFDLERISFTRVKDREFDRLDQFLLRIYPNEILSLQYDKLDHDPNVFYEAVVEYMQNFTNINELEQKTDFIQLIQWAVFFDNRKKRIKLPIKCLSAIDALSTVSSHLVSHKFTNRAELALPSVTSHAISFDILIYLPDDCDPSNMSETDDLDSDFIEKNVKEEL